VNGREETVGVREVTFAFIDAGLTPTTVHNTACLLLRTMVKFRPVSKMMIKKPPFPPKEMQLLHTADSDYSNY